MGWRELFAQGNTKTLGGSSKLGVSDYELITDGVHVEVDNLAALEAKNPVGQATNLQSQSGPIPETGKIVATSVAGGGSTSGTIFRPDAGEVWQITGATTKAVDASRVELHLTDTDWAQGEIGAETAAATQFDPDGWNPVYIDNNVYLNYFISGLSGTTAFNVSFIRVR